MDFTSNGENLGVNFNADSDRFGSVGDKSKAWHPMMCYMSACDCKLFLEYSIMWIDLNRASLFAPRISKRLGASRWNMLKPCFQCACIKATRRWSLRLEQRLRIAIQRHVLRNNKLTGWQAPKMPETKDGSDGRQRNGQLENRLNARPHWNLKMSAWKERWKMCLNRFRGENIL